MSMSTLDSLRGKLPPLAGSAGAATVRPREAAEPSAAWFNEPLAQGSRVLRAPPAAGASAQALTERFIACLCGG
jgi:hypothetical protein